MSFHRSVLGRGVISDNAKSLSDVIDRVKKSDVPDHMKPPFLVSGMEKATNNSYVATCPNCYEVLHLTLEKGLPSGWKPK